MMFKILAIVSLLLIAGTGFASYVAGGNAVRASMSKAIEKERRTQKEQIETLTALKQAKKVIYRDKIIKIKEAADPTGCTDTAIPADILNGLR